MAQLLAANRLPSATEEVSEAGVSVSDVVGHGGGQPLDTDTRADMETSLGHELSDVRVHTGRAADESAKRINANAYTVGHEIVFADSSYSPTSSDGRKTLAHELTHVVQQRSGPVDGTPTGEGVSVSDPSDRFERAAADTATRVAEGATDAAGPAGLGGSSSFVAQRDTNPDEEPDEVAQTVVAQREADEEEDENGAASPT